MTMAPSRSGVSHPAIRRFAPPNIQMILPMADIVGLFGVLKQQRGMRQFRR